MKLFSLLATSIFLPLYLLSQSSNLEPLLKSKIVVQTARAYYLKNTALPMHFIKRYVTLTKSFKNRDYSKYKKYKRHRSEDTLIATKQINKLRNTKTNSYCQLMLTRLYWEYEERLHRYLLDSASLNLRNNTDSAYYYFMVGVYCKDSINEILSRKLGFVKSDGKGNELVDWEKMDELKIKKSDLEYITPGINWIDITTRDIEKVFIPLFEKAIEAEKNEFFYMIELLLPLIRFEDEEIVQKKIMQYKINYSPNEQKWLEERMNESIARQKKAEEQKKLKK